MSILLTYGLLIMVTPFFLKKKKQLFDLSSSGTLTQFAECTYDLKGIHPLNFVLTSFFSYHQNVNYYIGQTNTLDASCLI